jgi:hypothetical protein
MKQAPPPSIAPEIWQSLLESAQAFSTLEPWVYACDSDLVGWQDPVSGEMYLANVMGQAGEVFAVAIYRRTGLRWLLSLLDENPNLADLNLTEGMDCLKLELVSKREMAKPDLAVLKAAGFKPVGRGCVWPQFRSSEPGWLPWYLTEAEAIQMQAYLPRALAFYRLFGQHPDLYEGRAMLEIPFLPANLPARPLVLDDLDWRPMLLPPVPELNAFKASADQHTALHRLKVQSGLHCEYDTNLVPGASFLEQGRPCFGRFSLLVETGRGLVVGVEAQSGAVPQGEAVGLGLVESLLKAKVLPQKITVRGPRLIPALKPLCDDLKIELAAAPSLPLLDEALDSLAEYMLSGRPPE